MADLLYHRETTSGALTYIFYFLAKYPEQQDKLRKEVLDLVKADPNFYSKTTSARNSPHLDAVIDETLRLWPAVLSGIQRLTPPEGITVGKTWIPGGVNVMAPSYVIQRRESSYVRGDEWIPERWYSQPELLKDNTGYAPFSAGPWSCVGKQLALYELRGIISHLISRFSVEFAPGSNGDEVVKKTTDHFASTPGPLEVILKPLSG